MLGIFKLLPSSRNKSIILEYLINKLYNYWWGLKDQSL